MAATLHSRFSLSVKKLGHIRASFFLNLMQIVLDRYSIALHCCRVYQCAESSMISIQTKISHYGVKPSKILLLYSKTAINNPTSNFRNSRILDPDFPEFSGFSRFFGQWNSNVFELLLHKSEQLWHTLSCCYLFCLFNFGIALVYQICNKQKNTIQFDGPNFQISGYNIFIDSYFIRAMKLNNARCLNGYIGIILKSTKFRINCSVAIYCGFIF